MDNIIKTYSVELGKWVVGYWIDNTRFKIICFE